MRHVPVLQKECLELFEGSELHTFFDGTLGAGGHAEALLNAHPEIERYIGCDLDEEAIEIARERLAPWKEKVEIIHGNFRDLDLYLQEREIEEVDGFFLTWGYRQCK